MTAPSVDPKTSTRIPLSIQERLLVAGSVAGLSAIAVALGSAPVYGVATIAGLGFLAILLFTPQFAFLLMLFGLTGVPYYVGVGMGRDIPFPSILVLMAGVFGLTLMRQAMRIDARPIRSGLERQIDLSVVILMGVLVIGIILSGQPGKSMLPLVRVAVLPLVIYIVCRHFVRSPDKARTALDVLLAGALIGSLYAVYEWFLGKNPLLEFFAPPEGDMAQHGYWTATQAPSSVTLYRSHGFGLNPIFFATTLSMLLIHAVVRFVTATRQSTQIVFGLACVISVAGLLATFSRGPILACGGGLMICALVYPSLRKYLLAALLVAAAYVAYEFLREDSVLRERINDTDNITLRFKLWQTAFAMFKDNLVFGVGLGQFPDYQLDVIRRHEIGPFFEMGDGRLETVKTAEHGVLQFLAETGILGGLGALLVALAVAVVYVPALLGRMRGPERALAVTAGTALIVFLLVGFTVTIYNSWEAGCLVPVMLATLCVASRGQQSEAAADRDERSLPPSTRTPETG